MRRFSSRYFATWLLALLLFLPGALTATRAGAQTTAYTLESYGPNNRDLVKSSNAGSPLPIGALIGGGVPITITGGANAIPGTYTVTEDIGSGYARLNTFAVNATGSTVTGISATIPDHFVKVTSAIGSPVITSGGDIQVNAPTVSDASGTVQFRLRLFTGISDTSPTNSAWVSYSGPNQTLSMAIPSQYQNTGKLPPFVAVEVKDAVADWPACGWLTLNGYAVSTLGTHGAYNPFYAPLQTAPTDAQILAVLPSSRLAGKHVTLALLGDSISANVFSTYSTYLDSLYNGRFTVIDGGIGGSHSYEWLPGATNTHRNTTSGENYYNYVLHRLQEAQAANSQETLIVNYFLGTNFSSSEVSDDATTINALKTALPTAVFIVHPVRTFTSNAIFQDNDGGLFLTNSDGQRALASASASDKIYPGTEKFYPYFLSHQTEIDAGVVHPQAGAGQTAHSHIWAETTAITLAAVLPLPISSITVSPATIALTPGQTSQTFTAVAKDSTGAALSTQPTFTWSTGAPSISSGGVLTVPTAYTISATASGVSGTATATLPVSSGGGGTGSGATLSQIQAELDARGVTAGKIASLPTATQAASAVLAAVVDGSLTIKQALGIQAAVNGNKYTVGTLNTTSHTQVTTYYRVDTTTPICTMTVTYGPDNRTPVSRSVVFSPLP